MKAEIGKMHGMLAKRTRIRTAKLLAGLFFFAQGVLAFAACDWGERSAARAVAAAVSSEAACHDADQGMGANVCVMHCVTGSQSLDKPAFKLPVVAPAPVFALPSRLEWAAPRAGEIPVAVVAPPPRVLFRVLLI